MGGALYSFTTGTPTLAFGQALAQRGETGIVKHVDVVENEAISARCGDATGAVRGGDGKWKVNVPLWHGGV